LKFDFQQLFEIFGRIPRDDAPVVAARDQRPVGEHQDRVDTFKDNEN